MFPSVRSAALVLLVACGSSGGGSGGGLDGGPGSSSVLCVSSGDPSRDYCYCGPDVTKSDANLVSSCSLQTLQQSRGACCAERDPTKGCICYGYICSSQSLSDHAACVCMWGDVVGPTTTTCTGTYCCQSPATSVLGGQCACGNTPCASGTTPVADCVANPAPACEPGSDPVLSCK